MTKDSNSVSPNPSPAPNDGRGRSYRPELGSAFEQRLDSAQRRFSRDDTPRSSKDERKDDDKSTKRSEKKEGQSTERSNENKGAQNTPKKFAEQDKQGQDGHAPFEGMAQIAPQPLQGLDHIAPVASVTGLDPALVAQLERIAAAIAEALPRNVDKQMSIAFGKADVIAQGAILTRDASGAISIHIAGLHPGVTAAQSVRLQQELRTRLMARKIDVRDVAFTDGSALKQTDSSPESSANQQA